MNCNYCSTPIPPNQSHCPNCHQPCYTASQQYNINYTQSMPTQYAQQNAYYTQQIPVYSQQSPVYTQQLPVYSQQSPGYTQQIPTYTQQMPTYTQQMPQYTKQRPPQISFFNKFQQIFTKPSTFLKWFLAEKSVSILLSIGIIVCFLLLSFLLGTLLTNGIISSVFNQLVLCSGLNQSMDSTSILNSLSTIENEIGYNISIIFLILQSILIACNILVSSFFIPSSRNIIISFPLIIGFCAISLIPFLISSLLGCVLYFGGIVTVLPLFIIALIVSFIQQKEMLTALNPSLPLSNISTMLYMLIYTLITYLLISVIALPQINNVIYTIMQLFFRII